MLMLKMMRGPVYCKIVTIQTVNVQPLLNPIEFSNMASINLYSIHSCPFFRTGATEDERPAKKIRMATNTACTEADVASLSNP